MPNIFVKDSVGSRGGLALFWRKGIDLTVQSMSRYHIDAIIREEDGFEWRFTGIYGESRSELKETTWKLLKIMRDRSNLPWLCCGDFNEIMFSCEKVGGPPRSENSMENFRQTLVECDLHDIGYEGDAFTWRNHHHKVDSYVKERLDRAVANSEWRHRYPLVRVINGDPRHSDHRPIIVELGGREKREWRKPMEIMKKFEARWLEEEEGPAKIEEAWCNALESGGTSLMESQKQLLIELWEWDKHVLGELEKRIRGGEKRIGDL